MNKTQIKRFIKYLRIQTGLKGWPMEIVTRKPLDSNHGDVSKITQISETDRENCFDVDFGCEVLAKDIPKGLHPDILEIDVRKKKDIDLLHGHITVNNFTKELTNFNQGKQVNYKVYL